MSTDFLSRLDEPRQRSWIQAAVGTALPAMTIALMLGARAAGITAASNMLFLPVLIAFIVGAALSLTAIASSFAGLILLDAPRPWWRHVEPGLVPLPFALLVTLVMAALQPGLY
ncbi:MAG: hypothetical protein ACREO3_10985 [Arenimonas sp.]